MPGPIYGGAYYTVVVADSPDGAVAFAASPLSLATTIGSAPGSQTISAAAETQPTPASTATTAPAEPAATEAPDAQATATPAPQPTTAPAAAGTLPTARVLTDPGVNVHLRQFQQRRAFAGSASFWHGRDGSGPPR